MDHANSANFLVSPSLDPSLRPSIEKLVERFDPKDDPKDSNNVVWSGLSEDPASPTETKLCYSPGTPMTPSSFQTPQLISKRGLMAMMDEGTGLGEEDDNGELGESNKRTARKESKSVGKGDGMNEGKNGVNGGKNASKPPRPPPPPMSPPPVFSKRQQVRLAQNSEDGGAKINVVPSSNPIATASQVHTLSTVEEAAYDLFDSRVMRAVNGWKTQFVEVAQPPSTPMNLNNVSIASTSSTTSDISMATPSPSLRFMTPTSASSPHMPSTPSSASSTVSSIAADDDPMYSALGDALWGGWRSFRDAVKAEALNAALELEQAGHDTSTLMRQSEEQADADAAAAAAAAVAVVSVTDARMPTALKEAARALSNAHNHKVNVEREKRKKAERGLAKGIADKAKMRDEMDKKGEEDNKEGGVVALGVRLSAAETEKEELIKRSQKLLAELGKKDKMVLKLSKRLKMMSGDARTPKKNHSFSDIGEDGQEGVSGLPLHIKNELINIASSAPADSPLKTGEFWSWLRNSPSPKKFPSKDEEVEGEGKVNSNNSSLNMDISEDDINYVDEDFKTFSELQQIGKSSDGAVGEAGETMDVSVNSIDSASILHGLDEDMMDDSAATSRSSVTESILMSPDAMHRADKLAKGSADLKEQLRAMVGSHSLTPNVSVARNLTYEEGEEGRGDGEPSNEEKERVSSPTPSLTRTNPGSTNSDESGGDVAHAQASTQDVKGIVAAELEMEKRIRAVQNECNQWKVKCNELEALCEELTAKFQEDQVVIEQRVAEERTVAMDMLTKKKTQNNSLQNRCRELENERRKLQQLLTELNEAVESDREMTPMKRAPDANAGGDLGRWKEGYEKAKEENLKVLRNMSEDMGAMDEELRAAKKEGSKLRKKLEEVMGREEEVKRKATEKVRDLTNVIRRSGVVGDEIRALKGDRFTLADVMRINGAVIAAMLTIFFLVSKFSTNVPLSVPLN